MSHPDGISPSLSPPLFLPSKKRKSPLSSFDLLLLHLWMRHGEDSGDTPCTRPVSCAPCQAEPSTSAGPNDTRRIRISGPVCFWSAKILLCWAFSSAITWSVHKKFRGWGLRQPWIVWPQTFHSCRLDRDLNLMRILFIYLFMIVFRFPVIVVISGLYTRSRGERWKTNTQLFKKKAFFSLNFHCARRGVYSKRFVCVRALTATLHIYELWAEDEG